MMRPNSFLRLVLLQYSNSRNNLTSKRFLVSSPRYVESDFVVDNNLNVSFVKGSHLQGIALVYSKYGFATSLRIPVTLSTDLLV